jgi:acetyl-CoA acetyltransferase
MQSRRMSAIEAVANVAIGYLVAVAANAVVLPIFGLHPSALDSFAIGALFTAISLARSYALRRLFNRIRQA